MWKLRRRASRPARPCLPAVELLEDRRLLCATAGVGPEGPADPSPHSTSPGLADNPGRSDHDTEVAQGDTQTVSHDNGIGWMVSDWTHCGITGQDLADRIHQEWGQDDDPDPPPAVGNPGSPPADGGTTVSTQGSTPAGSVTASSPPVEHGARPTNTPVQATAVTAIAGVQTVDVVPVSPKGTGSGSSGGSTEGKQVAGSLATAGNAVEVRAAEVGLTGSATPAPVVPGTIVASPASAVVVPVSTRAVTLTAPTAAMLGLMTTATVGPSGPVDTTSTEPVEGTPPIAPASVVMQQQPPAGLQVSGAARPAVPVTTAGEASADMDPQGAHEPTELTGVPEPEEAGVLDTVFAGMASLADNDTVRGTVSWVAAGAVAAMACELARRQVRRGRQASATGEPNTALPDDPAGLPPGDVS